MDDSTTQNPANETASSEGANESSSVGKTSTGVASPPQPMGKRGKKGSKLPLVLIVLALIAVLYFIFRGISGSVSEPTPSPTPALTDFSTPEPTQTPEPERADVSIEVLNGTGISGEAGYLQGELEDLGYEDIEVGNADDQDNETTTVTFASDLDQAVMDEMTELLEDTYQDVEVETDDDATTDVVIITGLREGQTPRPSPTATAEPTTKPATDSGSTN